MFQRDDPRAPAPAFLRRRSSLPVWADLAWRVGLILALVAAVLIVTGSSATASRTISIPPVRSA